MYIMYCVVERLYFHGGLTNRSAVVKLCVCVLLSLSEYIINICVYIYVCVCAHFTLHKLLLFSPYSCSPSESYYIPQLVSQSRIGIRLV